jgi:Arc/MetJ-type ribon-helix-helix transcriptional regulator
MGKTKDRPPYQSVSLPVPFVKEIKDFIKDKPQYRSIADFVKDSIREKMDYENFSKKPSNRDISIIDKSMKELKEYWKIKKSKENNSDKNKSITINEIEDIVNKSFNKRLKPLERQLDRLANEIHKK